jgi:serpin B
MFKKIVSAVIAITMVLGMCSCGEQSSSEPAKPGVSSSGQSEPTPDPDFYSNAAMTGNYTFAPAVNAQKNDEDFIKGMSGFSVELFKKAVNKDLSEHKNTLVSPESVAFALGMTMNGANGETLKQMQNVMCGGVELDKFNRNMNLIILLKQKR